MLSTAMDSRRILKLSVFGLVTAFIRTGAVVTVDSVKESTCPLVIGPNRTCPGVGLYTDPQDCSIFIKCFKGSQGITPYVYYCARNFSFNGQECVFYEGEMPSCIQEQCKSEPTKRNSSKIIDPVVVKFSTSDPTEYGNESPAPSCNVTAKTITVAVASLAKGVHNDRNGSATMSGNFWAIIIIIHLVTIAHKSL